jgi:DNA topoisomerase-1
MKYAKSGNGSHMSSTRASGAGLGALIAELHHDLEGCAAAAGLVYVDEAHLQQPGITRTRRGQGFSYRDAHARPLTDATQRRRLAALAIPPAWRDVWICPRGDGHILAVGIDAKGRTQYRYHERWGELRALLNTYRLISFADHLPAVRQQVTRQLRRHRLDDDRVLAAMVRILDTTAMRIGNEVYAEENDSFGLSTLTRRHVAINGDAVRFCFPAKSGKRADIVLRDAAVARVVTELLDQRSRRLFTVDRNAIGSAEVNNALHEWTDGHITAKDFRTWHGTLAAFTYLEEHRNEPHPERVTLAAIDAAADLLGNTRAVARAHYVHPHLIDSFVEGTFGDYIAAGKPPRQLLLTAAERRLAGFLNVAWSKQGLPSAAMPAKQTA